MGTVRVTHERYVAMMNLVDVIDELDDVQNVWSNFDIDEATMKALEGA